MCDELASLGTYRRLQAKENSAYNADVPFGRRGQAVPYSGLAGHYKFV